MKECPFCRERYADAQELCPACGRKPGDPLGELRSTEDRSLDEGFGPKRRRQFIIAISVIEFLFIAAAIAWFLKK
jgi:uncharacterized membrane protein YvbJ